MMRFVRITLAWIGAAILLLGLGTVIYTSGYMAGTAEVRDLVRDEIDTYHRREATGFDHQGRRLPL